MLKETFTDITYAILYILLAFYDVDSPNNYFRFCLTGFISALAKSFSAENRYAEN